MKIADWVNGYIFEGKKRRNSTKWLIKSTDEGRAPMGEVEMVWAKKKRRRRFRTKKRTKEVPSVNEEKQLSTSNPIRD